MLMLYVTCKDKSEAEKISGHLLVKKLIACANYFPVNSLYRWKGKTVKDNEYVLLLKTTDEKKKEVKKEIKKIHSYEIPCIIAIDVEANKEYDGWVCSEVLR